MTTETVKKYRYKFCLKGGHEIILSGTSPKDALESNGLTPKEFMPMVAVLEILEEVPYTNVIG